MQERWLIAAAVALLLAAVPPCAAEKDAPLWPPSYKVKFKMTVPYIQKYQPEGFAYEYQVYRDEVHGLQKMVRDGLETTLIDLKEDTKYTIVPAKDHMVCWKSSLGGGSGPTRQFDGPSAPATASHRRLAEAGPENKHWGPDEVAKLGFILPDLTENRWRLNGTVQRGGATLTRFTYLLQKNLGYGEVEGQYDFLMDGNGAPVELLMWGINLYTGGHFDDYRVYYSHYDTNAITDDTWKVDKEACTALPGGEDAMSGLPPPHLPGTGAAHVARVLPSPHYGDPEYDVFVHHSGRRHGGISEYETRRAIYYDNKRFIEDWNAGNHSHTCAMNHMGDWTDAERRMLTRKPPMRDALLAGREVGEQGNGDKGYKHMKEHQRVVPPNFLPSEVDWRGTPMDSPVKDQAGCGSCWAFSTVQSMETAYYRATGQQQLLSEQYILDCAWNVPQNHGCFGGDQDWALEFLYSVGTIATAAAMPYKGVFDFCPKDQDGPGFVKFEGNWVQVPPGEEAVKEAILTKGPMTVSIDASPKSMSFYKEGIYKNPECATSGDDLDHAVMLSGYGEEGGEGYWIVKNTWSTYWGEEGYIRVSRSPDDCGIASGAMYAEMTVLTD